MSFKQPAFLLREILKCAKVNTVQASRICEIPQPRFSEWSTGVKQPRLTTLQQIADQLGVDLCVVVKAKE